MSTEAQETLYLYKTNLPSLQYIFANGQTAVFRGGRYYTANALQVREMNHAISHGSPSFYVDPEELTTTLSNEDPKEKAKAELRDEIIAEFLASQNKDLGNTANPSGINASSTASINEMTQSPSLIAGAAKSLADQILEMSQAKAS